MNLKGIEQHFRDSGFEDAGCPYALIEAETGRLILIVKRGDPEVVAAAHERWYQQRVIIRCLATGDEHEVPDALRTSQPGGQYHV